MRKNIILLAIVASLALGGCGTLVRANQRNNAPTPQAATPAVVANMFHGGYITHSSSRVIYITWDDASDYTLSGTWYGVSYDGWACSSGIWPLSGTWADDGATVHITSYQMGDYYAQITHGGQELDVTWMTYPHGYIKHNYMTMTSATEDDYNAALAALGC